jgi:hypothetical protein
MARKKEEGKTGRPSTFSADLVTVILTRIMAGESLRKVCDTEGMPARSTVHLWLTADSSFSDQYARACEIRAEHLFDEMFDIADNEKGDPTRDRLRVDTRKWALSKMNPKKYSDKITAQHTGPEGGPIPINVFTGVPRDDS